MGLGYVWGQGVTLGGQGVSHWGDKGVTLLGVAHWEEKGIMWEPSPTSSWPIPLRIRKNNVDVGAVSHVGLTDPLRINKTIKCFY